jgi:hypothetical protein
MEKPRSAAFSFGKSAFFILPLILFFTSCNKYEDGPAFSLYTKTHRLANVWIIDKAYETSNGVTTDKTTDYLTYYYSLILTIDKKNLYSLSYSAMNILAYSEDGTWVYSGDKTHVFFTKTSSSSSSSLGNDWTILRLKEKQLWGSYTENNGTVVEIHFIPRFKG